MWHVNVENTEDMLPTKSILNRVYGYGFPPSYFTLTFLLLCILLPSFLFVVESFDDFSH